MTHIYVIWQGVHAFKHVIFQISPVIGKQESSVTNRHV